MNDSVEMTDRHADRWVLTHHEHRYRNENGEMLRYWHSHSDDQPHPLNHPRIIAIPLA